MALKVFWQKYFSIFINIDAKREDIKIRCQNPGICLTFIIWKHIFVFINTLIVFYLQHNKCFGVKSTQIFLLFGTHLFRDIGHSFNVFIICTYFQEWRGQKTAISYIQPFKYPMSVQILCFFNQIQNWMSIWNTHYSLKLLCCYIGSYSIELYL